MKKLFFLAVILVFVSLISFTAFLFFSFRTVPSGFATQVQNASVNLSVSSVLAITLSNDTINFGTCAIDTVRGYALLDSSLNSSSANNYDCFGGLFPSSLIVKNVGNSRANVSVLFSQSGSDFFGDSSSWLAYKVVNSSIFGGCNSSLSQNIYTNVTIGSVPLKACDDLLFNSLNNQFSLFVRAFINASASGGGNLTLTFVAHPVI